MQPNEKFHEQALRTIHERLHELRESLSYADARRLPQGTADDIVVAGREAQLTIFRQVDPESLKGRVLVTVQVARFGLGGTTSYRAERGLVFSADEPPREATDAELKSTSG